LITATALISTMSYLTQPYPASTTVQVSKLIRDDFLIEVEAIAVIGQRLSP